MAKFLLRFSNDYSMVVEAATADDAVQIGLDDLRDHKQEEHWEVTEGRVEAEDYEG